MFRFTIRDIFWLTILVGVTVSWALDRNKLTGAMRDMSKQQEIERRFSRLRDGEMKGIAVMDFSP
jgi:hypothetical protein